MKFKVLEKTFVFIVIPPIRFIQRNVFFTAFREGDNLFCPYNCCGGCGWVNGFGFGKTLFGFAYGLFLHCVSVISKY